MQGTKRVEVAVVALKCEVGRGHGEGVAHNVILNMNDAITVVNFGGINIAILRQHSHPMYKIQTKNDYSSCREVLLH